MVFLRNEVKFINGTHFKIFTDDGKEIKKFVTRHPGPSAPANNNFREHLEVFRRTSLEPTGKTHFRQTEEDGIFELTKEIRLVLSRDPSLSFPKKYCFFTPTFVRDPLTYENLVSAFNLSFIIIKSFRLSARETEAEPKTTKKSG